LDLVTYLRYLIRRPRSFAKHGDVRQRQAEEVQTVLRGSRPSAKDRFEREADQVADHLTAHSTRTATSGNFHSTLSAGSRNQRLPRHLRDYYEARLGWDLSRVRVHVGHGAGEAARAMHSRAFTVGQEIVFGDSQYAPDTPVGQRLLAHELAHVVQQNSAGAHRTGRGGRPSISSAPAGIQCDGDGSSSFQLQLPGGFRPWWEQPREPQFQLHLDPAIEAELTLMRMRYIQSILNPVNVRNSLMNLDPSILGTGTPNWLNLPSPPSPAPLVPPGAGPATPRTASTGDILRAVMAIPAVDTALTNLRTQAMQRARSDWRRLSTGERVLLVTQGVLVGGTALAGVLSNEQSRNFVLNQLQGRDLPVPLVPGLSFQFNITGPEQRIFFNLDLAQLIRR
jgi:Domain of unknown function (DUF4157)